VTGSARRSTDASSKVNMGSVARRVMTKLTCMIPSAQLSVTKPSVKTAARSAVFCSWSALAIGWGRIRALLHLPYEVTINRTVQNLCLKLLRVAEPTDHHGAAHRGEDELRKREHRPVGADGFGRVGAHHRCRVP